MIDPYHYDSPGGFTMPQKLATLKMPPPAKRKPAKRKPAKHPSLGTFNDRVNYAARVILAGAKNTTREFDNCFEMHDGDAVVSALFRRAQKNPKLAAMLRRVLVAEDCKDYFPGQDLNAVSLRLQAEADAKFKRRLAENATEAEAPAPAQARQIQTDLFNP